MLQIRDATAHLVDSERAVPVSSEFRPRMRDVVGVVRRPELGRTSRENDLLWRILRTLADNECEQALIAVGRGQEASVLYRFR
jgi:hypothetical protein